TADEGVVWQPVQGCLQGGGRAGLGAWCAQDRGDTGGELGRHGGATGGELRLAGRHHGEPIHARGRPPTAGLGSDAQARRRERNCNIYSLTLPSGEGGSAKREVKSMLFFRDGAVERTRTSTGRPTSTSS